MDGKSDTENIMENRVKENTSDKIIKKSLRSDSGISLEKVDNQDNLDKYNECTKKMDDEILCNLLKNVQKSLPSSGICSDDEGEYSTTSKLDYKSLIEALSSCNIDKAKDESVQKSDKKVEAKQTTVKIGSEISDINDILAKDKNKQHDKKSKKTSSSKTEKKSDKNRDNEKISNKIGKETEKLSSKDIMEQLSAKISQINLAKQQKSSKLKSRDEKELSSEKTAVKKPEISVNCNDKNHVQIVPRDTQNKKDKKYTILLERGPWTKPKTYGTRNVNPFYEANQQINTNILSGGKFWTAEEPTDLIPQTIPDFESILSKPISSDSKTSDCIEKHPQSIPSTLLEDTFSPSSIAEAIEREVMSFANGIDNNETSAEPNWGDYELVKNILEREAGSIDISNNENSCVPPTIVVNEYENTAIENVQAENQNVINEVNDLLPHQFIVSSPTSDRLHEVSYGCQRIDQLTPTSQTSAFSFDNQVVVNDVNNMPQTFELPPTPTDLRSPVQLYSPADSSLSLKVPVNSTSLYSPSPSIYSVNTGSPDQPIFMESPKYSKTPANEQDFYDINSILMNQPYYSSSFKDTFSSQMSSPSDSLLQRSTSNRSSFCGSDYLSEQCFTSPNADRIENQNYDNMYELSSPSQQRTTKESFSSSSPLESPDIYLNADDLESFTNALNHIGQMNGVSESISNQNNSNDICLQLHSIQNQTDFRLTQEPNTIKQTFINNNQSSGLNTPVFQSTHSSSLYTPKSEINEQKSSKSSKVKPIPIAAKQSYPCCVKMKKDAREILEEMFQRLDENMQSNVLLKVHTLDDSSLMKLLDTLLAGWGCAKLPIPRLPLLYVICERMLMTKTTMMKFFKTYGNGHTVLDRALLTCPQSPILSRYIAECSIKAMANLNKDGDFELDEADSLGNSIMHRAIIAGVECAVPLANLLQLNTDGTVLNVNRLNAEGYTPLHLACSIHVQQTGGLICSCIIMSHILLEHGKSNPNIRDHKSGMTALHAAVNSNGCSPALVSLLLKYGADPSMRNYYSSTVLDLAKSACRSSNNLQSAKQVVDILKKVKKP